MTDLAASAEPRVLTVDDVPALGDPSSLDRFLISDLDTDGRFSLVEHIIAPGILAAPMHKHHREDEFTFVREGRVGFVLAGREVIAEPGQLLFKPRGQWHTFWNAGDTPARMLELISPAGLEDLFREIDLLQGFPDPEVLEQMAARFGLGLDLDATMALVDSHGLEF